MHTLTISCVPNAEAQFSRVCPTSSMKLTSKPGTTNTPTRTYMYWLTEDMKNTHENDIHNNNKTRYQCSEKITISLSFSGSHTKNMVYFLKVCRVETKNKTSSWLTTTSTGLISYLTCPNESTACVYSTHPVRMFAQWKEFDFYSRRFNLVCVDSDFDLIWLYS